MVLQASRGNGTKSASSSSKSITPSNSVLHRPARVARAEHPLGVDRPGRGASRPRRVPADGRSELFLYNARALAEQGRQLVGELANHPNLIGPLLR
jgi:hypothetical protein